MRFFVYASLIGMNYLSNLQRRMYVRFPFFSFPLFSPPGVVLRVIDIQAHYTGYTLNTSFPFAKCLWEWRKNEMKNIQHVQLHQCNARYEVPVHIVQ